MEVCFWGFCGTISIGVHFGPLVERFELDDYDIIRAETILSKYINCDNQLAQLLPTPEMLERWKVAGPTFSRTDFAKIGFASSLLIRASSAASDSLFLSTPDDRPGVLRNRHFLSNRIVS
jgi:hypothetical protein